MAKGLGIIHWSTTPGDMTVRVGDAMVHRVVEIIGSDVTAEECLLECGARVLTDTVTVTTDDVDCMACALRRMTQAMEDMYNEYEAMT